MKIRTKLLAIAVVPITVFLATGMSLFILNSEMKSAHERVDLNAEFGGMTSNLLILTYEYGITSGERPKKQWESQYAALGTHIKKMMEKFYRPAEKSLLTEIGLSYKTAGSLFAEICGYDSKTDYSKQSPMALQLRNNMANRLILELQAVVPPLDRLTRITHEDQVMYARVQSLMIIIFMFSLVAIISPLSFFIVRGISRSLLLFQQGMKIVASGNLNHRINMDSGDELGALARGFDEMTGQLRSVTVSRDELATEIDERKKAEEALQEREEQYHMLFEGAPDAIFIADPETGIIIDANVAASRMIGRPNSEIIGMHQAGLHPPDIEAYAKETFRLHLEEALQHKVSSAIEHTVLRVDGSIIPVEILVQMVTISGRSALQGVFRDITARKKAQDQFAHEAALNATMFELSRKVLMAESIEEISVITLNEAQKITGSRFGFVGHVDKTTGFLVCPTMTHDIWDQCSVSGKSIVFEKHGGLFGWVLGNKKALMTNDPAHDVRSTGVPSGHIPINRFISVPALHGNVLIGQIALANAERDYNDEDIAAMERLALIYALGIRRKQAEEDLRNLNEDLERRVADRTTALEIKGLELQDSRQALMNIVDDLNLKAVEIETANRKLQELDRLKSMFIASMSHELRTPLNSIIGFSSILLNEWVGHVTEEQRENLAIILRSGKHLLSLINDVIDVSKVEAGIVESRTEDFDLYDVVSEAVSSLEKEAKDKGLDLRVEAVHLEMHTDRKRLLQCLLNLLSNAAKFTEKGSITLRTLSGQTLRGRSEEMLAIAVEDTGIGIADDDIPKLFRPFVRLESPLKMTVPGTGLGLYLTKKLVTEVLKGEILCERGSAAGSRFVVRIPVRI